MTRRLLITLVLLLLLPSTGLGQDRDEQVRVARKQDEIRAMAQETLEWLREQRPGVMGQIEASSGFAVFDNLGTNARLPRTAYGFGVARNSKTGQVTYMRVRLLGGGIGMGVGGSRVLLIFEKPNRFDLFTREGMQAPLAIEDPRASKASGESYGANLDDVVVYQITSRGLATHPSISGTKFWKDDNLN